VHFASAPKWSIELTYRKLLVCPLFKRDIQDRFPGRTGVRMKFPAVFVTAFLTIAALTQTSFVPNARAQTPECRALPDPGQRLACYDMAAPPAKAAVTPAKRGSSAKSSGSKTDIGSPEAISAEDALMAARMKNICRGC
jgi:hypothetical protein